MSIQGDDMLDKEKLREAVLKDGETFSGWGEGPKTFAQKISDDMGLGFNLGNSFDAIPRKGSDLSGLETELAWSNPHTTRDMIKAIKGFGFKTLRLPVSWHIHVSGRNDEVDSAWMNRIKEVACWCMDEDMYVILNTHHDICEGFLLPDDANIERSLAFMKNIWAQVSESFKGFPADKLLFESMNEIRVPHAAYEWTPDLGDKGCVSAMENINRLNQVFVQTVRSSGGNNFERCLVIPGYATSTEGVCWDGFKLPIDKAAGRLMVAVHMYSPAHFVFYLEHGANDTTFDIGDTASTDPIDERLYKNYEKFIKNGIPVSLNEFGTVDKNNDAERVKCLEYTVAKATSLGIRLCYWDNGQHKGYGNAMAVFDRRDLKLYDKEAVAGMLLALNEFERR